MCVSMSVPCGLENPLRSMMWSVPDLICLTKLPCWQQLVCDFCCFGTKWQKPTRCWLWHAQPLPSNVHAMKCNLKFMNGERVCKFTGEKHVQLSGAAKSGGFRTKQAEEYPTAFAQLAIQLLIKWKNDRVPWWSWHILSQKWILYDQVWITQWCLAHCVCSFVKGWGGATKKVKQKFIWSFRLKPRLFEAEFGCGGCSWHVGVCVCYIDCTWHALCIVHIRVDLCVCVPVYIDCTWHTLCIVHVRVDLLCVSVCECVSMRATSTGLCIQVVFQLNSHPNPTTCHDWFNWPLSDHEITWPLGHPVHQVHWDTWLPEHLAPALPYSVHIWPSLPCPHGILCSLGNCCRAHVAPRTLHDGWWPPPGPWQDVPGGNRCFWFTVEAETGMDPAATIPTAAASYSIGPPRICAWTFARGDHWPLHSTQPGKVCGRPP